MKDRYKILVKNVAKATGWNLQVSGDVYVFSLEKGPYGQFGFAVSGSTINSLVWAVSDYTSQYDPSENAYRFLDHSGHSIVDGTAMNDVFSVMSYRKTRLHELSAGLFSAMYA